MHINGLLPFRVTRRDPVALNSTNPTPILGFGFSGFGRKMGIAQGVSLISSIV